eukprot:840735-Rhodomonas_salina.1
MQWSSQRTRVPGTRVIRQRRIQFLMLLGIPMHSGYPGYSATRRVPEYPGSSGQEFRGVSDLIVANLH